MLTYRNLLEILQSLTPEQLEQNVTVRNFDAEYHGVMSVKTNFYDDVLDEGHVFLDETTRLP